MRNGRKGCLCPVLDSPALQKTGLRERSSVLLPGVDERPSRWAPQNKEPLEAPQSTRGLKPEGSVQPLVGG